MPKLFIIKSRANGIWCEIGKANASDGLFSSYWIRSSFKDATRFNRFEAFLMWFYLKSTHKWMGEIRAEKIPLKWFEKQKS